MCDGDAAASEVARRSSATQTRYAVPLCDAPDFFQQQKAAVQTAAWVLASFV
jgi:hypothetical protein